MQRIHRDVMYTLQSLLFCTLLVMMNSESLKELKEENVKNGSIDHVHQSLPESVQNAHPFS